MYIKSCILYIYIYSVVVTSWVIIVACVQLHRYRRAEKLGLQPPEEILSHVTSATANRLVAITFMYIVVCMYEKQYLHVYNNNIYVLKYEVVTFHVCVIIAVIQYWRGALCWMIGCFLESQQNSR